MKEYVCKNCGAELKNLGNGVMGCDYCGSTFFLENDENIVDKEIASHQSYLLMLEAAKYQGQKAYDKEISCYMKVLEIDTKLAIVWAKLGIAYRNCNMYEKALECYNKAIEIEPSYAQPYGNVAVVLMARGKYLGAIQYLLKALEQPNENVYDQAVILANLAYGYGMSGNKERFEYYLEKSKLLGYDKISGIKEQVLERQKYLKDRELPLQVDDGLIEDILVEANLILASGVARSGAMITLKRMKIDTCESNIYFEIKNWDKLIDTIRNEVLLIETTDKSILCVVYMGKLYSGATVLHLKAENERLQLKAYTKEGLIKGGYARKAVLKYESIAEMYGKRKY